ncbi:MAG: 50S ribosomal protein L10 [Candidatus Moranbacteria bacterium]|jgi:large subunit ribosomal protein L10|nr:50S ribosomal protein L10 [Candidatus Moranbacteria bacterium]MBP9801754.1 50S ribosomal protein L10 [Candidatus Moranbacteria bacterium]
MQTRQKKEAVVAILVEKIRTSKAVVYAQYQGVTVKSLTSMRKELAKSGSSWQVMKKTLLSIALKEAGIEGNVRELPGQVGVAFSSDEVAAAKTLAEFIKANKGTKLSIEGGALGEKYLSADETKALAKLPSRDELRGMLVGTLQAPISGFVRTLSGNLSGLVRVLKAVEEKKTA